MIQVSDAPGMMTDRPLQDITAPEGIEIRHIVNVDGVVGFRVGHRTELSESGNAVQTSANKYSHPRKGCCSPHNYLVVAYDQEQPVSAAMILFSHSIAGIYWVGTLEQHRGRGLAQACVRDVTQRGLPAGSINGRAPGQQIRRHRFIVRMGFKEVTRYPWYMYFEK